MSALVAGFGNIFLSDDGLGCAVARMLAAIDLGPGVRVRDFGTGGVHLSLEMLSGYDTIVVVDAISRDAPPGTVFAIDCSTECAAVEAATDAHAMSLSAVFSMYTAMRQHTATERQPKIFIVGCVPQNLCEGMELSEPVRAALPACVDLISKLTRQSTASGADT
jgi:hydrogenase maturation protease